MSLLTIPKHFLHFFEPPNIPRMTVQYSVLRKGNIT